MTSSSHSGTPQWLCSQRRGELFKEFVGFLHALHWQHPTSNAPREGGESLLTLFQMHHNGGALREGSFLKTLPALLWAPHSSSSPREGKGSSLKRFNAVPQAYHCVNSSGEGKGSSLKSSPSASVGTVLKWA